MTKDEAEKLMPGLLAAKAALHEKTIGIDGGLTAVAVVGICWRAVQALINQAEDAVAATSEGGPSTEPHALLNVATGPIGVMFCSDTCGLRSSARCTETPTGGLDSETCEFCDAWGHRCPVHNGAGTPTGGR